MGSVLGDGESPDMASVPGDGDEELPDSGNVLGDGESPDMASVPGDGESPDISDVLGDGESPDMASVPGDGESLDKEGDGVACEDACDGLDELAGDGTKDAELESQATEAADVAVIAAGCAMPVVPVNWCQILDESMSSPTSQPNASPP